MRSQGERASGQGSVFWSLGFAVAQTPPSCLGLGWRSPRRWRELLRRWGPVQRPEGLVPLQMLKASVQAHHACRSRQYESESGRSAHPHLHVRKAPHATLTQYYLNLGSHGPKKGPGTPVLQIWKDPSIGSCSVWYRGKQGCEGGVFRVTANKFKLDNKGVSEGVQRRETCF